MCLIRCRGRLVKQDHGPTPRGGRSAKKRCVKVEMALHEEAELRALRGELSELEHAWRDAEEIAAIADNTLTPSSIQNAIDRLRRKGNDASFRDYRECF